MPSKRGFAGVNQLHFMFHIETSQLNNHPLKCVESLAG